MIPVMPGNPERALHDDGKDSPYSGDSRFYRLSFNGDFITSQAATVISSGVIPLFMLSYVRQRKRDACEGSKIEFSVSTTRDMSPESPISRIHAPLRKFSVR